MNPDRFMQSLQPIFNQAIRKSNKQDANKFNSKPFITSFMINIWSILTDMDKKKAVLRIFFFMELNLLYIHWLQEKDVKWG